MPRTLKNAKEFKALLVDLAPEPQEILKSFRKGTKVDIEKDLKYSFLYFDVSEEPKYEDVEEFLRSYDAFAPHKGILPCHKWIRLSSVRREEAFPGSGNLSPEDKEMRKLSRKVADLKEENGTLKKPRHT